MAIHKNIRLECTHCAEINYLTSKNSKKHPQRLQLNKFCSRCRQYVIHKETKKK